MADISQGVNWLTITGIAVTALLLLVVGVAVLLILRRARRHEPVEIVPALRVDVARLGDIGPPADGPRLRLYNVPVRLGVLVLAPVGREGVPPTVDELPAAADQIVPGLGQLLTSHKTTIKIWPPQLSSQGFANKFFANVALPGDHGKGSPWCSLAGRFETGDRALLAGLALCAEGSNSMGQYVVEHDAQWFDMLRITDA
jgi:hypothetical protein